MRRIGIFTTSRADFGVYAPLLHRLSRESGLETLLFVGGTHLAQEHGHTIEEIEKHHLIADTFDFFLNTNSEYELTTSIGVESFELARIFRQFQMDVVCVLGDRFEILPIVTAAIIHRKPIVHLFGGEVSEGALDEQVRHMITKAAHVHCVTCREYARNILRLGEEPWRVHVTGTLAADTMMRSDRMSRDRVFHELGLSIDKPTALLTFHPVTLEFDIPPIVQITNLFDALDGFDIQVLVTAPNIDINRDIIMAHIHREVKRRKNFHYHASLGAARFHGILPHCSFVIGNSSSGIAEVPYYRIPTVNIGNRQHGRVRHRSVIDCGYGIEDIEHAVHRALDPEFRTGLAGMRFKFGNGHAADRICAILTSLVIDKQLMRKTLQ